MPGFSDWVARLRELFSPSAPDPDPVPAGGDESDAARQKERNNIEREEPPSHPWDAAREKSEAPGPDDSSQGATLPELPAVPEEEPDADGAIPPD